MERIIINTGFKSVADSDSLDWKDYGVDGIVKSAVENKRLSNSSIIMSNKGEDLIINNIDFLI